MEDEQGADGLPHRRRPPGEEGGSLAHPVAQQAAGELPAQVDGHAGAGGHRLHGIGAGTAQGQGLPRVQKGVLLVGGDGEAAAQRGDQLDLRLVSAAAVDVARLHGGFYGQGDAEKLLNDGRGRRRLDFLDDTGECRHRDTSLTGLVERKNPGYKEGQERTESAPA